MNLEASVFSLWLRNETKASPQYFSPYMKPLKALARPGLREKKKIQPRGAHLNIRITEKRTSLWIRQLRRWPVTLLGPRRSFLILLSVGAALSS